MNNVFASNSMFQEQYARAAVSFLVKKPVRVRMHPAQVFSIINQIKYLTLESVPKTIESVERVARLLKGWTPETLLDIPIEQDSAMNKGIMEFLDETGEVVAMIYALAIPMAFVDG